MILSRHEFVLLVVITIFRLKRELTFGLEEKSDGIACYPALWSLDGQGVMDLAREYLHGAFSWGHPRAAFTRSLTHLFPICDQGRQWNIPHPCCDGVQQAGRRVIIFRMD